MLTLSCLSLWPKQLSDSVRVHFRVNKIVIDPALMANDSSMRSFDRRMAQLSQLNDLPDFRVTIDSILITGAASPEGSIPLNEYLSRERAGAITRWLRGFFEFPDTMPRVVFKGRDWQGLLDVTVSDPHVPYKAEVVELLNDIINTPPSERYRRDGVARLKALRGGVPYRYLWKKHFPGLRASEVFITATVVREASELPAMADLSGWTVKPDLKGISDLSDWSDRSDLSDSGGYQFGVRTNLIQDAVLIPNIGVEFPIGRRFSAGANWMYTWLKNHDRNRHWRIYGGDVNARWYFGAGWKPALQGHHVGLYAQVLLFQIANGGKGYITGIPGQDIWGKPWLGCGAEYGYSRRIGRRLNLDFTLGLGYLGGEYRVYRPIDGCYVWQSTHRTRWFGPTKAEISLVWLIGKEARR